MQRLSSRVISLAGHAPQTFVLDIAHGRSIWEGVSEAFTRLDIHSAHVDLMGAALDSAVFFTGYPDPAGKRIAQYGAPNHTAAVMLVAAMGIYGNDKEDRPTLHCHGCFVNENGLVQGGHLDTEQCIVGHTGLRIYVTATCEIGFVARLDATSEMFVFHPAYAGRHDRLKAGASANEIGSAEADSPK